MRYALFPGKSVIEKDRLKLYLMIPLKYLLTATREKTYSETWNSSRSTETGLA